MEKLIWLTIVITGIAVFETSDHGGEPFRAQHMHIEHRTPGGTELSMEQLIDQSPTAKEFETSKLMIDAFYDDREIPLPPLKKGNHDYAF